MKICLLLSFCALLLSAQGPGSVDGVITDSATGKGISGVSVSFSAGQGSHYETATDSAGKFQLKGMTKGQYGSHFERAGYVTQDSGTGGSSLKTVAVDGPAAVHVQIHLLPFATLRGRVLDYNGKPEAETSVWLNSTTTTSTATTTTTASDADGQFVFNAIPPGKYTLEAIAPDAASEPVQAPGKVRTKVVSTWFPVATDSKEAKQIDVRGGANLSGYEVRLRTVPVYRVRGVVLDEHGKPETQATVYDSPAEPKSTGMQFNIGLFNSGNDLGYFNIEKAIEAPALSGDGVSIKKDGTFEISSVRGGTRKFTASIQTKDDSASAPASTTSTSTETASVTALVDHDLDQLRIQLAPHITVAGSIQLEGVSGPAPPATIRLHPEDGPGGMSVFSEPNGKFSLDGVPAGRYLISITPGLPGGYYLASIMLGDKEVLGQMANLQAGSPPIRFLYKPNGGTVTGSVEGTSGAAVLLIAKAALDSPSEDLGRISQSGTDGSFKISSVGPGSYYAIAVNHLIQAKIYDLQTLRKLVSKAVAVEVSEGATVSVKLKPLQLEE